MCVLFFACRRQEEGCVCFCDKTEKKFWAKMASSSLARVGVETRPLLERSV